MVVEYSIIGGCLKIHKNMFLQELLSKESLLRSLLNWKSTRDLSIKHPNISEPDENNIITISFSSDASVSIGESPKELLGALKVKYGEKIKGKVSCMMEYSTFGGMYTFEVDLNSEGKDYGYISR